ncbi:hypothetical protein MMPV_008049 [Pyropia vietnamensis]
MASPADAPAPVEDMMQLVSYDEQFESQFDSYLDRVGLAPLGFDYHTVSVMGAQSSGKSTLLNLLFHTGFRTMDATAGRSQTTQGVWAGRDPEAPILLLDLEGTDSRERGEEAANFERKSSLFALALSEVLVINLWAQDVGRFNAANLSLLRTVLELDLQLFSSGAASAAAGVGRVAAVGADTNGGVPTPTRAHKTRLLFVLRDHAMTPLELLASTLREDVDNIWATIAKPAAAASLSLDTFFDLDFVALPHKVFCEADFLTAVAALRTRFHDGSLFLPAYRRGVAADGLAPYARSVWETIRANKELDIPSQQAMLAHVRCEAIAGDAFAAFQAATADVREALQPPTGSAGGGKGEAGKRAPVVSVPRLLSTLADASTTALATYDGQAHRYTADVAASRRLELVAKLAAAAKPLVAAQAAAAAAAAKANLDVVAVRPKGEATPWEGYAAAVTAARTDAIAEFLAALAVEDAAISSTDGPSVLTFVPAMVDEAREALVADLDEAVEAGTVNVRSRLSQSLVGKFGERVKAPLTAVLDSASTASSAESVSGSSAAENSSTALSSSGVPPPPTDSSGVWARVSGVAAAAWTATAADAEPALGADGLDLPSPAVAAVVTDELRPACAARLLADIREAVGSVSTLELRVTRRFDDGFRFDARGVPRTFAPGEDIEAAYLAALTAAESLLTTLSVTHVTGPVTGAADGPPLVEPLVAPHEREAVSERLRRAASAVYVEARRSQEAARVRTAIPWYLWGFMALLGANEAKAVIQSPSLLLLVILVVPIAYVLYAGGEGVAPLLALLPATVAPAVRRAAAPMLTKLRAVLDDMLPPPPAEGGGDGRRRGGEGASLGYGAVSGAASEVTDTSGASSNGLSPMGAGIM